MKDNESVRLVLTIEPKISLWDAIKLRIAGGAAARAFWEAIADRMRRDDGDVQ